VQWELEKRTPCRGNLKIEQRALAGELEKRTPCRGNLKREHHAGGT